MAAGRGKGTVTRRDFLKGVGSLVVSGSLFSAGVITPGSVFAVGGRKLAVGTFGPSHCAATFIYPKVSGLVREGGLDLSLVNYPDMASIARDLAGGRIEMGQLVVPLAFALHAGAKPFTQRTEVVIPMIAGINGSALMVRKGSGIVKPEDFKGKTTANHSPLAVNHLLNMMFLESNGLNPDRDVKIRQIELSKVIDAIGRGEIDAFLMPEPVDALAEHRGFASVYLLSKYIWPNHPCCALVCRRDFFEKNTETVAAVTKVMTKGALTINAQETRKETVELLHKTPGYGYDKMPLEVLSKAFTPGRADFSPFPYQSSALIIIDIMKRHGLLPTSADDGRLAREVFLSDFSRKIMAGIGATPPESDFRAEKILGKVKTFGS
jgi:nitrate/nitrite transport system substrate-binding protein